ncbi:MAG: L-rhamnose mutarotase, partial [Planctomycetota bacterium]
MNVLRYKLFYAVSVGLVVWFVGGCAEDYKRAGQAGLIKRYCWMADLQEDEDLMEEYKQELRSDLWKRVCDIMKERGVLDYEIYQFQNRLLMIIETELDFNIVAFGREISGMAEVRQWAGRMNRYFQTIEGFENSGWWVFLDRVYKLKQKKEYDKVDGYVVRRAAEPVRRICDARQL